MRISVALCAAVILFSSSNASAHDPLRSRADKHAPASLMGDHVHAQGEWMVEYRYMNMYMDDNRSGSRTVSDADSIAWGGTSNPITNRGATPTDMTMEMHMVHVMYGLNDEVTLYTMAMLPSITMDHLRGPMNMAGPGTAFTTHNSGFGDTTIGALLRLYADEDDDLILNLSGSLPTGRIFRTTTIPSGGMMSQPLPYPMRPGSGTFNARPGITWKRYFDFGSVGAQFQSDLPIGRNYRNYSVSDEHRLNFWHSLVLTEHWATTLRLENLWRSKYDGADPNSVDAVISTNVEAFRGGYWLNLGVGSAFLLNGHLLNMELVPTLYQDLNGIQLETDWSFVISWSKSF